MTELSSDLAALIREIERHVVRPSDGLPEELFLFLSRIVPLVNVDLLIQDDARRTLLTWRDDRYFGPGWHIPGGVIRHAETAADRVRAVARLELGATVTFDPAPILVQEAIRTARRDRSHAVSLVYRCRLDGPPDPVRRFTPETPRPDQWHWHERCPDNLIPEQCAYAALLG